MDVTEFSPITQRALKELLAGWDVRRPGQSANGRRRAQRWPFPATVELWVPTPAGEEEHVLASCLNISMEGMGIRCNEQLAMDAELSVSIHQPEVTLFGKAAVRHITPINEGYYIGLEFLFEETKK